MERYVYAKGFREQVVQMMRDRWAPRCRVVRSVAGYFALSASKY
jgi:hypothetical protein